MRKTHRGVIPAVLALLIAGGALAGCGAEDTEAPNPDGGAVTVPDQPGEPDQPDAPEVEPEPEDGGAESVPPDIEGIGMDEASQIALDKFGGELDSIEPDDYKGIPVWEVELDNTDLGMDLEVLIDRETGEILHYEED